VADIDALLVGRTSVSLGAGRIISDEPVDATAGILLHKKVGQAIKVGELVATVYGNKDLEQATTQIQSAIQYSSTPVVVPVIITHRVTANGMEDFCMPEILK
jgi:pyrimidine-nucleoside phosphorylase